MAGDTANAELWTDADVYLAAVGVTFPADVTTAWSVTDFTPVGLLDGDEGFTETRDDDSSQFYAWGGILVKSTKSKHQRKIKFVCLEDNAAVFGLVNPGSTQTVATGLTTSTVVVPKLTEIALGFEVTDGVTTRRRFVPRASVDSIDDVKQGENDLTVYSVTVVIYPDASGVLYTDLEGAAA